MHNNTMLLKYVTTFIIWAVLMSSYSPDSAAGENSLAGQSKKHSKNSNDTYEMLVNKRYEQLEQKYNIYLQSYLNKMITAEELGWEFDDFHKIQGVEILFDEWVSAYPTSYSARLARSIYLLDDGFSRRGGKFANETTDKQHQEFKGQLEKARLDLVQSLKLFSRPIVSYTVLIRISYCLSLGRERAFLGAALAIDSKAFQPRAEYLYSLTPKWGGNPLLMKKFIDESKISALDRIWMDKLEGHYFQYLAEQATYDKDYRNASYYYLKSFNLNNKPEILLESGKVAEDGNLKDLALSRYEELVKKYPNYVYGLTYRGHIYEVHLKDYDKALKDYISAADLGDSWAQNKVGLWYMTGDHVSADLQVSTKYFSMAAKQNNRHAIKNLKSLRTNTLDAKMRNFEKNVFTNVLQLAKQGDRQHMASVGESYLRGDVVGKDEIKAFAWLTLSGLKPDQLKELSMKLLPAQLTEAGNEVERIKSEINEYKKK